MDGIIEGLMLEHSPYSPRKRLPYLLPPTSFDPTAALPAIPQLSTELPPALELGPLERFRPLPPLAEPPQVDNLGEVFEKLPQLKCGAETGPGAAEQGSVGSRPKRHRRVKTQPSPLASAGNASCCILGNHCRAENDAGLKWKICDNSNIFTRKCMLSGRERIWLCLPRLSMLEATCREKATNFG